MTKGLLFWIIMLLWLILGLYLGYQTGFTWSRFLDLVLFTLVALLGWQTFGPPIKD